MSTDTTQATCAERVAQHLAGRLDDLRKLWAASRGEMGEEVQDNGLEDLGRFEEYGLCFDYVGPQTFADQAEGYFRYQLSYGGPSDEFRFFVNPDLTLHRVEYWFLDWFDGAHIVLTDDDYTFLAEIWNDFEECEAAQTALDNASK